MDMQNITDLHIPEGNVRTIHDKNNRLLWGRLSYDVKYSGNIDQNTYTGKNLLPPTQDFQETLDSVSIDYSTGVFTIDGTSATSGAHTTTWRTPISSYTIQSGDYWHYNNDFSSQQMLIQIRFTDNSTLAQAITAVNRVIDMSNYVGKTIKDMRLYFQGGHTYSGTMSPMIVSGVSTATTYEPYVGGIPAPNPNYPQDIHIATGSQTITLSDGVISQAYTIDLGLIELAKIGTYQDYIYKSGDDWYIHKATGKLIFTGESAEGWSLSSSGNFFLTSAYSDVIQVNRTIVGPIISNYYSAASRNNLADAIVDYGIGVNYDTPRIYIRNKDISNANDFKTWLSSHNTVVYYALATPTDTKITNNTLIGQLNDVHEWLTRYGYNAAVTGNLPIIINKTNL